jgi:hypothetical protein
MEDFIVTSRDMQSRGFCLSGSRRWFHDYGLDFNDFLKNGILASRLLATGDGMAETLVSLLRGEE